MEFDAKTMTPRIVEWIRNWFEENGKGCNAVVGISGGKDSSVVAALCCEALGKERVIGVMMPNGIQPDINCSQLLCSHLGIRNYTINVHEELELNVEEISDTDVGRVGRHNLWNLTMILNLVAHKTVGTLNLICEVFP